MRKPDVGERDQHVAVEQLPGDGDSRGGEAAEDRSGQPDARLGKRVVAERAGGDESAHEGDEHRRA